MQCSDGLLRALTCSGVCSGLFKSAKWNLKCFVLPDAPHFYMGLPAGWHSAGFLDQDYDVMPCTLYYPTEDP